MLGDLFGTRLESLFRRDFAAYSAVHPSVIWCQNKLPLQKNLLPIELVRFGPNTSQDHQDLVDLAVSPQPNEILIKPRETSKRF